MVSPYVTQRLRARNIGPPGRISAGCWSGKPQHRPAFRRPEGRKHCCVIKIGFVAGLRPAGGPTLRFSRLESGRNPIRKPDFLPGGTVAKHRVQILVDGSHALEPTSYQIGRGAYWQPPEYLRLPEGSSESRLSYRTVAQIVIVDDTRGRCFDGLLCFFLAVRPLGCSLGSPGRELRLFPADVGGPGGSGPELKTNHF